MVSAHLVNTVLNRLAILTIGHVQKAHSDQALAFLLVEIVILVKHV
jgi:hypothetical protein